MTSVIDRRQFLQLAGLGTTAGVSAPALPGMARAAGQDDFYFVQLSDTHWGFEGAPNPDAKGTLKKAVASVNALSEQPAFIVFTGDLTHTTDDPAEHDASLDSGKAFKEFFGATYCPFDHKGVHFIALDNVSDPRALIGEEQLAWLGADLKQQRADAPIVVLTHRPLFDLAPQWDWATRDGAKAVELLMPFKNVTVFYGHIHQEHHHMTAHIAHHAAKGLMFPLPAPGSQPNRAICAVM